MFLIIKASDLLQARLLSLSLCALQMEYAIWKTELEMKKKEYTTAELQKEETLKRLDLQILECKVQLVKSKSNMCI